MPAQYPSFNDREFDLIKKWVNNTAEIASGGGGGGAVSSVFGRTGSVVAQPDDYAGIYAELDGNNTFTEENIFAGEYTRLPQGSRLSIGSAGPYILSGGGNILSIEGSNFVPQIVMDFFSAEKALQLRDGVYLQLSNPAVAETPPATHTLIIKDSNGVSYKALCTPV